MTRGAVRDQGRGAFLRISGDEGPASRAAQGGRGGSGPQRRSRAAAEEEGAKGPRREPRFEALPAEDRGRRRRGGRPLLAVLGVLLGVLALTIGVAYLASTLRLQRFEVAGAGNLEAAEVVAASGLKPGSRLLGLDLGGAVRRLESWAPVAGARAKFLFPDAVRLEILERKPVAYVLVDQDAATLPVAVDAEGVSFAERASVGDLPVLSGLRFESWSPGTRLPDYLAPTLASLGALEAADPALLSLFSEIRVERSKWGEVELLLFPLHHAIPVRTGPRLDASLLRSIVLVLDALDKGGLAPGVGELDFRSGTVVFRSKEGRSG